MLAVTAALGGILGAALGSFLNVVIWRLPRGESVVAPPSACPGCGVHIRAYDNVPVLSWFILRGRCRDCATTISPRYPAVEVLTAALVIGVILVKGADPDALLGLTFVLLLVPVAFIDLDHRIIPNRLMLAGALLAPVLVLITEPADMVEHLIAAVAAGGFLLAAAVARPGGMGMGDVKLAGVMGLFLGHDVGPAMLVALVAGSLVGGVIIARHGTAGRKTAVPFGPFLALGGVIGLLAGEPMIDFYLETFA
jgi:leader peptidase (prepilin peptidase)/N-methyltransferase